jgi:predicted transcriptional regulator
MGSAELKSNLHALIDHTSDDAMLRAIYTLLSSADTTNTTHDFSDEERVAIEKGLTDVKNGRVVPHEEVMKNTRDRIEAFRSKNG